jgi:hypothetical protein
VQAKGWNQRPSVLLGLAEGSYEAYCLDEAVFIWGGWVQQELQKVKGKTEAAVQRGQERKLTMLLGKTKQPGTFRDPAGTFNKG